jgi:two-component system, sensor histidine kinase
MSASRSSILLVPGGASIGVLSTGDVVSLAVPPVLPISPENARAADVAMISHELRNSLSVLLQAARLLRLQPSPDITERALTLIDRHVRQMSRHVEDLMDTTPLRLHKDLLRLTAVDLRMILKNCVEASSAELARRRHALTIALPEEAIWVKADAFRLEQVFSNLLNNAAKYTLDGGQIAITLARLEGEVVVRVCDSGIGIPPALLSKIFELFVQVNSTTTVVEGGRGIGLAVVRDLVEMHGGRVTAASAGLGFGSEFTVLLPELGKASGSPPAPRNN